MNHVLPRGARVAAVLVAIGGMIAPCACGDRGNAVAPNDAATIDAGAEPDVVSHEAAGDAAPEPFPAWDPVWHTSAPKAWPTTPNAGPNCGPGCRIALAFPYVQRRFLRPASTDSVIGATGPDGLFFAGIGATSTQLLAATDETHLFYAPSAHGDLVAYATGRYPKGQVEVMNRITGERKVAVRHEQGREGDTGFHSTAINEGGVFWLLNGILFRRDLRSGEVKRLNSEPLLCESMCATPTGVVCSDYDVGKLLFVSESGGPVRMLDDGGALQLTGSCSPDRKFVSWIDYRDPPGNKSGFYSLNGGEVYIRDLVKGETRRVTFDSETSPRGKLDPTTDGRLVVWSANPLSEPNPSTLEGLYRGARVLEKLDLETGVRCSLDPVPGGSVSTGVLFAHHYYGLWLDRAAGQTRVIDLDLDSPELPWSCTSPAK